MGAGAASLIVGPSETLWRLIENLWYRPDLNGKKLVQQAAFVGEISLLRVSYGVTEQVVDGVKGGKFKKYGVAEFRADEVCGKTKGELRGSPDADWPPNAHVIFIRASGGKQLRLKHQEVTALTDLANQRPLRREPKP